MRFIDWFAGIGGFRLGLERQGFEHAASCELAEFPRSVYAHHWGEPQTYEDVTRVEAKGLPKVDLWAGGFPCQDVSQAGEGKGLLGGARSGLVFRLLGLAAVAKPRWIFLENVPGLLVRGRGFDRLLGILSRLGYGWAYRRLDAQYFGVAQRRKRIILLACLDPDSGMRRAAKVLLEPESLRGDPPPRRAEGEGVAYALTASAGTSVKVEGNYVFSERLAATLSAGASSPGVRPPGRWLEDDQNVVAYTVPSNGANELARENPVAKTLASNGAWGRAAGGTLVIPFSTRNVTRPDGSRCDPGSPANTLSADPRSAVAEAHGRWVRRLMPIECERLQGFPDGWTAIPGASDAQRYKALGNAVAVPVVSWIAKRLAAHS